MRWHDTTVVVADWLRICCPVQNLVLLLGCHEACCLALVEEFSRFRGLHMRSFMIRINRFLLIFDTSSRTSLTFNRDFIFLSRPQPTLISPILHKVVIISTTINTLVWHANLNICSRLFLPTALVKIQLLIWLLSSLQKSPPILGQPVIWDQLVLFLGRNKTLVGRLSEGFLSDLNLLRRAGKLDI